MYRVCDILDQFRDEDVYEFTWRESILESDMTDSTYLRTYDYHWQAISEEAFDLIRDYQRTSDVHHPHLSPNYLNTNKEFLNYF